MELIYTQKENYVEVKNFVPESAAVFRDFLRGLTEKYPDCTYDFVYTKEEAPACWLAEIGAELIDDCLNLRLSKQRYIPVQIDTEPTEERRIPLWALLGEHL